MEKNATLRVAVPLGAANASVQAQHKIKTSSEYILLLFLNFSGG